MYVSYISQVSIGKLDWLFFPSSCLNMNMLGTNVYFQIVPKLSYQMETR